MTNATNYPIARITNLATGHVFYGRTSNHSTMGVATGPATVFTNVTVPLNIETGPSTLEVVTNGIASFPLPILVGGGNTTPKIQSIAPGVTFNPGYVLTVNGLKFQAGDTITWTMAGSQTSLAISSVPGIIHASGGGGVVKGFPGVSLSVSNETAPPGATTQVKISVTEPKPILTGGGSLSFSAFDSVFGIAIIAPGQDTFGVALERGTNVALSVLSPSSSLGMNIDYPILTIAGRVPATAPIGAKFVLPIDTAAFHFLGL